MFLNRKRNVNVLFGAALLSAIIWFWLSLKNAPPDDIVPRPVKNQHSNKIYHNDTPNAAPNFQEASGLSVDPLRKPQADAKFESLRATLFSQYKMEEFIRSKLHGDVTSAGNRQLMYLVTAPTSDEVQTRKINTAQLISDCPKEHVEKFSKINADLEKKFYDFHGKPLKHISLLIPDDKGSDIIEFTGFISDENAAVVTKEKISLPASEIESSIRYLSEKKMRERYDLLLKIY